MARYTLLSNFALLLTLLFCTSYVASQSVPPPIRSTAQSDYNMAFPDSVQCAPPKIDSENTCQETQRNFNGYCTNHRFPLHGIVDGAQVSYDYSYRTPSGLQSPRLISNYLTGEQEHRPIPNKNHLTDAVTFMGQFLDHNLVFTGTSKKREMSDPIDIPAEDPIAKDFVNGKMNFMKSVKACDKSNNEDLKIRPVNCLPGAIDLSGVYGPKLMRANALRKMRKGLLKFKRNKRQIYPPLYKYLPEDLTKMVIPHDNESHAKAYSHTRKFFMVGDQRGNENPVLAAMHTLFLREHNRLAKLIKKKIPARLIRAAFPEKRNKRLTLDEGIFQMAKRLNEAAFQSVIVNEYFPAMTFNRLPSIKYDPAYKPTLSDIFSTVAFRVGHTLVGKEILLVDQQLQEVRRDLLSSIFFEENSALFKDGVDPFLRGAMWHKAQQIDLRVVEELRTVLFQFVKSEEMNRDLTALNLQRSRDHSIPSYTRIREILGLPKIRTYSDISKNQATIDAIESSYPDGVDTIEAFAGLLGEDHDVGKPMGPTMLALWEREFIRLLRGDRFNYKENRYHPLLWRYFRQEINDIQNDQRSFSDIIVDNTDIRRTELPNNLFINRDAFV